ncbi:MAG: MotA/TolQ/ExbB proton channel family protein [Myxococcota bacterium]
MKRWTMIALMLAVAFAAASADAQDAAAEEETPAAAEPAPAKPPGPAPKSLFELLDLVQQGLEVESEEQRQREARFKAAKQEQERLLAEAKDLLAQKEALSQRLEAVYNENEGAIGENEARLAERLGQMGELFGAVRLVATEASGNIWESLTSAQLGQRKELLDRLGRSKELPSTADLERLWYELQREMTQQGQVVRFEADVLSTEGSVEQREVVRAGPFSAVSDGKFLVWEASEGKLRELTRQPPSKYLGTVESFESATEGFATLAVDPSRGQLLAALTDTPSPLERVNQGGYVGYTIITLGVITLVLGLFRWVGITIAGRKVAAQRKSDYVNEGNPLGRVLSVFENNRDADAETLELKLDEAVMREASGLQRLLWIVKTISVVAPLLGLLGTVTGMIQTFQAITLFGAGDPKMMAGGISEALVTTMLGLITAIPLVLLYDLLANSSRRIIDILDEQSAGLIAARSARDTGAGA